MSFLPVQSTTAVFSAGRYDRSSLRVLGCVGEPLNHEAWQWYNDVVGDKRCDVIDTWWQTGESITDGPGVTAGPLLGFPLCMLYCYDLYSLVLALARLPSKF